MISNTTLYSSQTQHTTPDQLSDGTHTFRLPKRVAIWLYLTLAISLTTLLAGANQLFASVEEQTVVQCLTTPLTLAGMALHLIIAALFLRWGFQSSTNAALLVSHRALHPPKAFVSSFFIPPANFVLPLIIMLEIGAASSKRRNFKELLVAWWLCWLAYLLGAIALVLPIAQTFKEVAAYSFIGGGILGHLLLAACVIQITAAQKRRAPAVRRRT